MNIAQCTQPLPRIFLPSTCDRLNFVPDLLPSLLTRGLCMPHTSAGDLFWPMNGSRCDAPRMQALLSRRVSKHSRCLPPSPESQASLSLQPNAQDRKPGRADPTHSQSRRTACHSCLGPTRAIKGRCCKALHLGASWCAATAPQI